ncbi:MAG TPA: RusA family crossover junction endodeoxyribonuclease [Xanthobacteraceae bacterium]|nr:RusA family crossover junction endodeoxyribonuclease [Xanthobacteraceae bacterium]
MTPKGKKIKQDYRYEVLSQWRGTILKEDLTPTLRFYFKTKRKQDLDNYNKLVLDALSGIVYLDDSQVAGLHLYRCYDKDRPRIEVDVQ